MCGDAQQQTTAYRPGWEILKGAADAINNLTDDGLAGTNTRALASALSLQVMARIDEIIPKEHEEMVVSEVLKAEMRISPCIISLHPSVCRMVFDRLNSEKVKAILAENGDAWKVVGEPGCVGGQAILSAELAELLECIKAEGVETEIGAEKWRILRQYLVAASLEARLSGHSVGGLALPEMIPGMGQVLIQMGDSPFLDYLARIRADRSGASWGPAGSMSSLQHLLLPPFGHLFMRRGGGLDLSQPFSQHPDHAAEEMAVEVEAPPSQPEKGPGSSEKEE